MIVSDKFRRTIEMSGLLTRTELILFFVLLQYAHTGSYKCFPSIKRLAAEAIMSVSTVKRALKSLTEKELLTVTPQKRKDGGKTTNLYTLQMDPKFWGIEEEPAKKTSDSKTIISATTSAEEPAYYEEQYYPTELFYCAPKAKPKKNKITNLKASEEVTNETISMDEIKSKYNYSELVSSHMTMKDSIIDPLFRVLNLALNHKGDTIKINSKLNALTKDFVAHINSLTADNLATIINRVNNDNNEINSYSSFLRTCIYNFIDEEPKNLRAEVMRDMKEGLVDMDSIGFSTNNAEDLISVGEVRPDGSMDINIIHADDGHTIEPSEKSAAAMTEAQEPSSEKKAIDKLLGNPGKVDYDALMSTRNPWFRKI